MVKTILIYLLLINIAAFAMFGIDKWKAKNRKYRIPEAALLLSAALGGSVGAICGMDFFRHKTLHRRFKVGLPLILFVQAGVAAAVYLSVRY